MNKTKTILIIIALFAITATDAFSQVQGRFRGGLDAGGWSNFDNRLTGTIDLNLGYNIRNNMNVGIRVGASTYDWSNWSNELSESTNSNNIHFMGTYTYFFGSGTIMPFIGGGVGLHLMDIRVSHRGWEPNYGHSFDAWGSDNRTQIGGLLTAGVEFGKFRIAAQYNLLPATNITLSYWDRDNGQHVDVGTANVRNSYFALTVGFYIGGGNRRVERLIRERDEAQAIAERAIAERADLEGFQRVQTQIPERVQSEQAALSFSVFANQFTAANISRWEQRGEFEQLADWQQRVSEQNRQTKTLELMREAEQIFIEQRSYNFLTGAALGAYNPDTERFLLQTNLHGTLQLPVSISEGQNFRDNWNSNRLRMPRFVVHNDQLAFAGIAFIATDGATFDYNFPTPVEITISEHNLAALQNQRANVAAQPTQPVTAVLPDRQEVAEVFRQVESPDITATHDVIVLRNGNLINALVSEITLTEIRYRAAENPHGPIIALAIRDVFSIDFANGTRQVFEQGQRQGRQGRGGAQQGIFRQGDFAVGGRFTVLPASEFPTFGIGAIVRYNITVPIRLEGGFTYFLPLTERSGDVRESVSLWDFSMNMHYLFTVAENVALYPLIGFSVAGGAGRRIIGEHRTREPFPTFFSFNLGGGLDIKFNHHISINMEPKLWLHIDSGIILARFMPSVGIMYRF